PRSIACNATSSRRRTTAPCCCTATCRPSSGCGRTGHPRAAWLRFATTSPAWGPASYARQFDPERLAVQRSALVLFRRAGFRVERELVCPGTATLVEIGAQTLVRKIDRG